MMKGRLIAALAGLGIISVDTSMNVANQANQIGTVYDPSVVATVVVAAGTSIGCMVALECFQSRAFSQKILGVLLCFGVAMGVMFSFVQSNGRTASQQHAYLTERASNEEVRRQKYDANRIQAAALDDEIKTLAITVERECFGPIDYNPRVHNASNFPRCHPAYVQLQELRAERNGYVRAAESQEVALWEVDENAALLAMILPYEQKTISEHIPLLLPIALLLLGFSLFTIGTSRDTPEFALDPKLAAKHKAQRYVESYLAQSGGKKPTAKQIVDHCGVTLSVAKAVRLEA